MSQMLIWVNRTVNYNSIFDQLNIFDNVMIQIYKRTILTLYSFEYFDKRQEENNPKVLVVSSPPPKRPSSIR